MLVSPTDHRFLPERSVLMVAVQLPRDRVSAFQRGEGAERVQAGRAAPKIRSRSSEPSLQEQWQSIAVSRSGMPFV